jgi:RNA polymerase sigma-70 factor (ECF subfamily)
MTTAQKSLESYLHMLRLYVRQFQLGRRHLARFGHSDVVSEALRRAVKGQDGVRGTTEAELVAWLQTIVENTFKDFIDTNDAAKRDPRREVPIIEGTEDGQPRRGACRPAPQPGASTIVRGKEDLLRLAAALDRLPDAEREAVSCHYIDGLPLAEVAERMKRTVKGVAGLLYRGKNRLRELMAGPEDAA